MSASKAHANRYDTKAPHQEEEVPNEQSNNNADLVIHLDGHTYSGSVLRQTPQRRNIRPILECKDQHAKAHDTKAPHQEMCQMNNPSPRSTIIIHYLSSKHAHEMVHQKYYIMPSHYAPSGSFVLSFRVTCFIDIYNLCKLV
eukprot:110507_1